MILRPRSRIAGIRLLSSGRVVPDYVCMREKVCVKVFSSTRSERQSSACLI